MKHLTLAAACMALMAAPALGDWADDFQSYALNSTLAGQNGWAGWDGGTANAIASDEHAKFAGDKAAKLFQNDDLVCQHSGYTSGGWVYSAKQYIPSSQKGAGSTFFILMNNYNVGGAKGWAVTLKFNLNLDLVFDIEGGYVPVPITYDAWMDIRVEIDLDRNLRNTYYGGTLVGSAPWYDRDDPANHAKSIAALDLWADVAGNPVYYDDLSITPWTPTPPPVRTDDLTTYPGREARYLVNLGRAFGDTSVTGTGMPSLLHEITSGGGNQQPWWRINDGNPHGNSVMVTFSGSNPDFFGYKFKLPATVKQVVWWNQAYFYWEDGGTFAATPELQYLDAPNGTWQTIADVTWDRAYLTTYGPGCRKYEVTLNTPVEHAWGIRFIGNASETPGPGSNAAVDDDGDIAGAGFVGVTEMTLYGEVELGALDLSNNLAFGATAIANDSQYSNWVSLTNGATEEGNYDTTWSPAHSTPAHEDYLGVIWATPQNNVAAMGVTFAGFGDGGYFDPCSNLRIEYTTDGSNWIAVSGLDLGRYSEDWTILRASSWGPDTSFLFRFDPVSGITGLRIIGNPDGYSGDADGFIGASELEVFANKVTGLSSAKAVQPALSHRIVNTLQYVWTIVAL
ncbi:MAG TPA: hypothetical protein PKY77_08590 [Phycisphaerae bacterium]|nr:hypothetical protein [Phycisphaerae bacterium]HRY67231.1 hypothetical protein [Phycisphaerae bacterium]HSA26399.1 hypothetical protein [Phycisphaerae bacterium]